MLLDFKLYAKAIVIKTVSADIKTDTETNGTEYRALKLNFDVYSQLMFTRRSKNTQWGKYILFNKWC